MNFIFTLVILTNFCLPTVQPKPLAIDTIIASPSSNTSISPVPSPAYTQVKWTWQLPVAVRVAFNKSHHANWFIEKMVYYNSGGEKVYRLFLNNSNLLDGDHKDCFLQAVSVDIIENGTIVKPVRSATK